jgi:hypothetical protein
VFGAGGVVRTKTQLERRLASLTPHCYADVVIVSMMVMPWPGRSIFGGLGRRAPTTATFLAQNITRGLGRKRTHLPLRARNVLSYRLVATRCGRA